MFGYFEINYSGKPIFLGRKNNNKSVRFLQILLSYRSRGIPRHELMHQLFKDEEVADLSNSLRVNQHRMKKMLMKGGLPFEEYFVIRDGVYYWNEEISIITDVELFDEYIEKAFESDNKHLQMELLYQAFHLYQGEFLDEVGVEEWAIVLSVDYKMKYEQGMRCLIDLLREKRDYQKMLEVSSKVSQLYPYDEWQTCVLESLKALGRKQEAFELYQEVAKMYREELDIDVPDSIMEQMYDLGSASKQKQDITKDICDKLGDSLKQSGAACLNFQNFVDTFRLMMRISERNGTKLAVMLCELNDEIGLIGNKEKLDSMMQTLKETIQETLRRGDCFTQYSNMKYLILLSGATDDKCEIVFDRIDRSFSKVHKSWMSDIKYQVIPIDSLYKML